MHDQIRQSIFDETGCSASAGASNNMLLARYAFFRIVSSVASSQSTCQAVVAPTHLHYLPASRANRTQPRQQKVACLAGATDRWPHQSSRRAVLRTLSLSNRQALFGSARTCFTPPNRISPAPPRTAVRLMMPSHGRGLVQHTRMATKEAKPDGQFWLPPDMAMRHMGPLPVQVSLVAVVVVASSVRAALNCRLPGPC